MDEGKKRNLNYAYSLHLVMSTYNGAYTELLRFVYQGISIKRLSSGSTV